MDIRQILNALDAQRPLPHASSPNSQHTKELHESTSRAPSSEQPPAEQETIAPEPSVIPSDVLLPIPTSEEMSMSREEGCSGSVITPPPPPPPPFQRVDQVTALSAQTLSSPLCLTPGTSAPRPTSRIQKPKPKRRGKVGGNELNGLKDWLSAPEKETEMTERGASGGRTSWNSRSTWV